MTFSRGGDEAAFIDLPPSTWDKLLAVHPRTHDWSIFDKTASEYVTGNWSPFLEYEKNFDIYRTMRCFDSPSGKEVSCISPELPLKPKP
jgi:hypothetical protein